MHRHGERDQVRSANARLVEGLERQVEAVDVVACRAQGSGGRGEAQRLVAELVGGEQEDARPGWAWGWGRRPRSQGGDGHYFFDGSK